MRGEAGRGWRGKQGEEEAHSMQPLLNTLAFVVCTSAGLARHRPDIIQAVGDNTKDRNKTLEHPYLTNDRLYAHRGRHDKMFGWVKSAADDRRSTSDLWPLSDNVGIADKQKSLCDVSNIQ